MDYYTEKRLKMLQNLELDMILDAREIPKKLMEELKRWTEKN